MSDATPGVINPEQLRTVCEQAERDLRMALKTLSEPDLNEGAHRREVRELVQAAHDIIESILLDSVAVLEEEDSKSAPGQTCPAPTGL
jgi:hypothetical protein